MKKFGFWVFIGFLLVGKTAFAQQLENAATVAGQVKTPVVADSLDGWKFEGITGANFSQVSLTNWTAGGENSIAGNVFLKVSADYTKNRWAWDNDLGAEFGMTYSDENDWRKNLDKIALSSQLGYEINKKWFYAFLLDFNSQFAKGYDYTVDPDHYISAFMAPAYSNAALGISYKPHENYSFFLSPVTLRTTVVLDDSLATAGSYGMKDGNNFLMEPGAYFVAKAKQKIVKNVDLVSKLDMFTPYNSDFGNVDINWELLVSCKVNEFLNATLSTTLRYYDRESSRIQFKEMFGLGLSYKFAAK